MSDKSSPRRVVHIIGQLMPGGVEIRTLELIRASNETEFEHFILVISGQEGILDEAYRSAGARIIYLPLKSPSFPLRFYTFLVTRSIDVVHSYIMHSSGFILAIARAAGVGVRIAQFRSDGVEESALSMRQRWVRRIKSFLIDRNATIIAGLTPANLEIAWNPAWQADSRCLVLPNGIVSQEYSEVRPVHRPEGLERKVLILHVGRGELPSKNRNKAIAVVASVRRSFGVNAHLVFLGRDGRSPEEAAQNRRRWDTVALEYLMSDHITYAGERSDVAACMLGADLLLFTSTLEGLPGVILEARASGLPIVATNLPGIQFIVETFPDVSLLDAEASDEDWAKAVIQALDTSLESRHERQQQFRGSRFDFEITFEEYKKVWSS